MENMPSTDFKPVIDTYDRFLEAFVWMYSTTNPNPAFSEFHAQIDSEGYDDIGTLYLQHFINNMTNIQEGLVKYIKAVAKCGRYGRDDYKYGDSTFVSHINMFIERGASITPCTRYLMKTHEPQYLEDLSTHVAMRMPLVDAFWDQLDQEYIKSLTDWSSIKPADWETIVFGYDVDIDQYDRVDKSTLTPAERENKSVWFYMYMKYLSSKLKTL